MNTLFAFAATTGDLTVRVNPSFLPEQSDPARRQFAWMYHVRIENGGSRTVQLINRHWIITDGAGRVEEVEGAGVVGEQPVLPPGARYDYVSGCQLMTPWGTMHGSYAMEDDGRMFSIEIPRFRLDSPFAARR